jgi:membrane-bound metal-dependent hydrolase YbcI (DUF457 family)
MLIGYMLGWMEVWVFTGYNEYLILLSVVMAVLPDFDILLYAIPGRVRRHFRGLNHRGITHTIVFVAVFSIVVSAIFNIRFRTPLVSGIGIAFIGGLSHVTADLMTSYSVPHLAPFDWRPRSLNIDGAITWYMIPYSLVSILTMWEFREYHIPIGLFYVLITFVFSCIGVHYALRISVKYYVEKKVFKGMGVRLIPTIFLLSFYLSRERRVDGVTVREYSYVNIRNLNKFSRRYYEIEGIPSSPSTGMPADPFEAVARSSVILPANGFTDIENASAIPSKLNDGSWEVFWFDWHNWRPVKETGGILVRISGSKPGGVTPARRVIRW